MPPLRRPGRLLGASLILSLAGCASIRITSPDRAATEQFLLSQAASRAVSQLRFESLRGRAVYVDRQYFAASEPEFVLGELRARLLTSGIKLVRTPEEAQVVLEVRSGGVGIDSSSFLLGVPSLIGGGDSESGVPLRFPELALLKNVTQEGFASVAFVAYWAETGEIVASSGPYIGVSLRDDWWFFGAGPGTVGDIPPVTTVQDLEEYSGSSEEARKSGTTTERGEEAPEP